MAKKKVSEEFAEQPTGDAASAKWKEFMVRLDELSESVETLEQNIVELADLGESILQALKDAAQVTQNPLLGLLEHLNRSFTAARDQYRNQRDERDD